jgi:hypothetical protein
LSERAQKIEYALPMPAALKIRRKVRPLLFRVLHPLLLYWNRRPRRAQIGSLTLRTDPAVFHPASISAASFWQLMSPILI